MRQLLVHNVRLLPSDQDLMQLPLDDVKSLQNQLQQELSKLSIVRFVCFLFLNFRFIIIYFRLNKRNPIIFNRHLQLIIVRQHQQQQQQRVHLINDIINIIMENMF
jgi:hypothetical protein